MNDIEVSIENIQKLSKELQVSRYYSYCYRNAHSDVVIYLTVLPQAECSKLTSQALNTQSTYKDKLDVRRLDHKMYTPKFNVNFFHWLQSCLAEFNSAAKSFKELREVGERERERVRGERAGGGAIIIIF